MKNQVKYAIIFIIILILAFSTFNLRSRFEDKSVIKTSVNTIAPFSILLENNGKVNFEITTYNGPANEVPRMTIF